MGQIFYATVYRPDTLEYVSLEADKFHANCYSFSGAVKMMHHYLRQGAWNVCYRGYNTHWAADDFRNRTVDPLVFALFEHDYVHMDDEYKEIAGEVDELFSRWKSVYDSNDWPFETIEYTGLLLNHDKKEAMDLAGYYAKSICDINDKGAKTGYCADPIPVLTENGEGLDKGSMMLFFNGCTADSTEELAGAWCRDKLGLADVLPEGYAVIDCVFAEAHAKMNYCYDRYGTNADDMLLNADGDLFGMVKIRLASCTRGETQYIKAVLDGNYINFSGVFESDFKKATE